MLAGLLVLRNISKVATYVITKIWVLLVITKIRVAFLKHKNIYLYMQVYIDNWYSRSH